MKFVVPALAAAALAAAPVAAQPGTLPADAPQSGRNFDATLLAYAALPAAILLILVLAASSDGDGRPASA